MTRQKRTTNSFWGRFLRTKNDQENRPRDPATTEESSEIYDLQGRRLSTMPQKGVYIQNGKKIVVK